MCIRNKTAPFYRFQLGKIEKKFISDDFLILDIGFTFIQQKKGLLRISVMASCLLSILSAVQNFILKGKIHHQDMLVQVNVGLSLIAFC